jgi:hypothetical protein
MLKMSLIVYGATGHVLGAFTRAGDPEGAVTAEQVVGDGLLVRDPDTGETLLTVAPQHLEVKSVDRRDDVILAYRDYVLEDNVPVETLSTTGVVTYVAPSTLKITLPSAAPRDLKAWVQIEDGMPQPIVTPVDIVKGDTVGSAVVTLTPGDYNVLALVPGFRTLIFVLTVP